MNMFGMRVGVILHACGCYSNSVKIVNKSEKLSCYGFQLHFRAFEGFYKSFLGIEMSFTLV